MRAAIIDGDGFLTPRVLRSPALEATPCYGWPTNPRHEAICFFWHEMALYVGPSLDSVPHRHFCLELTLALDGELDVSLATGGRIDGLGGALFGSNVAHHHRQRGARTAQLIVGPLTAPGLALRASLGDRPVGFILPSQAERFRPALRRLIGCDDVAFAHAVASAMIDHFSSPTPIPPPDDRAVQAMVRLLSDFTLNTPVRRFAKQAGLSESRFSHVFRSNVGVPMRTYRRWLRLRAGIVFALSGLELVGAAHDAGFADQADFARACREAFGVPPSVITRHPTAVLLGEAPGPCALMSALARG